MKIFFVASEIRPYASTGGLSDVAGALPIALQQEGINVVRAMPMYRQVLEGPFDVKDSGYRFKIPVGLDIFEAEIWEHDLDGVRTYFIRRDEFFDRSQLYALPNRDYTDNFSRFVFFQKAVVELIDALGADVDIVHANDWQTGLLGCFLKYGVGGVGRTPKEKVCFTIHNLAYPGQFPAEYFYLSNLPFECFSIDVLEYYDTINCLKGGLVTADLITTVSPTYAREIQTEEFGCGLEGVISNRSNILHGIVNGIDATSWDPAHDKHLQEYYDVDNPAGKQACKAALQKEMGLPVKPDLPLFGMISRLVEQKGIDLLLEVLPAFLEQGKSQFVLLGSGQEEYQDQLVALALRYPKNLAVKIGFDNALAHRIEAGADLFLMPSRFEPCGLNQLYSLRYGTVPIVHAVGGLNDTVQPVQPGKDKGTGFVFAEFSSKALTKSMEEAMALYKQPSGWDKLRRRGMAKNNSWSQIARTYLTLYKTLLGLP